MRTTNQKLASHALNVLLMVILCLCFGCASDTYHYGDAMLGNRSIHPCGSELQRPILTGGEHPVIDRIEKVVHSPKRLVNKIRKQPPSNSNHEQKQAVTVAQGYFEDNGLHDINIDVRRYEPREQWQRLVENNRIGPIWKYTAGSLDILSYSLLPKRAFHSDSYSPFTNTLSINSHSPASAIFQAAQAKQYRKQRWLGTYAVTQKAPVVPLYHYSKVASDALTYSHVQEQSQLTKELYPIAYAKLGSAAISGVVFFFPLRTDLPMVTSPLIKVASRSTGRLAGKLVGDLQTSPDLDFSVGEENSKIARESSGEQ